MDTRGLVQAYFERMNSEDWEGLGELFHDEAELEAPGFPRQRGRDTVRGYFQSALGIYPEHYDDPVRIVVAGDTATVNIHYEGTLANGYQLSFDAVDVFDMRDGKIGELTSWYDSHEVRRALLRGRALDGGPQGERARLRLALGDLRGRAHALGGQWSNGGPAAALCVPAVVVDVDGELTAERAAEEPSGWALLVRGASAVAPAALDARPAGGCDTSLALAGSIPWALELDLDGLGASHGAFVAPPSADGTAHAVFIE